MEHRKDILKKALVNLPAYEPDEEIWATISQKLNELPLHQALFELPDYEPDDTIWQEIETKSGWKQQSNFKWWYAVAVLLLGSTVTLWLSKKNDYQSITFSEEIFDSRLFVHDEQVADDQYHKIQIYCVAETVICNSQNFKQLKKEYETLRLASDQLQQAMGKYNTEPELMRQFSLLEQEKTEILNKMAKMI